MLHEFFYANCSNNVWIISIKKNYNKRMKDWQTDNTDLKESFYRNYL